MRSSRRRGGGLSGEGVVVLVLALGLAGVLFDVLTGPGLRTVFAVCFVGGCLVAAATVRRRDLPVAVVMPPLVYAVMALVTGLVEGGEAGGSFLVRQALDLFTTLVLEAPVLLLATGGSLAVALVRASRRRSAGPRTALP
ncbi:MAG: hypothetical protein M3P93_13005, partial [Actinomycetota bacterium]|nr:hypothetical protein [Actinomycetota bacterium]